MIHRDLLVDALLQAQLDSPEETSKQAHTDLGPTVGHRIIGDGILFGDLIHVLQLDLGQLDRTTCEYLNGWFVVALDNDAGVPHPLQVLEYHVHNYAILIQAFARDDMAKD